MRVRLLSASLTIGLAAALLAGSGAALARPARSGTRPAAAGQRAASVAASATAARWRVVFRLGQEKREIQGITAPGRRDAWAYGVDYGRRNQFVRPFFLHWGGQRWRQVTIPAAARAAIFPTMIASSSPGNVWIIGYRTVAAEYDPEALVFNGRKWSVRTLPATFNDQDAVVLSRSEVWSASFGLCPPTGPCPSLLQEWNGSVWRSFTVAGYQSLAGVGGHLWSVGVITTANGPKSPPVGAETLYRWTGTSWQRVAAPDGQVRGQPKAAVSPAGKLMILARGRKAKRSHLDIRSGTRWSRSTGPAPVQRDFLLDPLVSDGHGGAWEAPEHWTGGSRWTDTYPQLGSPLGHAIYNFWYNNIAPIPGTSSTWALVTARGRDGTSLSGIAVFGRLP